MPWFSLKLWLRSQGQVIPYMLNVIMQLKLYE